MNKTIITVVIFFYFINAGAQNLSAFDVKVANKMEIFKEKVKNRKIENKDKILYDSRTEKEVDPAKLSKELLRKHFASNGMNDYNFEFFRIKVENIEGLDYKLIQRDYPELFSSLENDIYNKVVYSYDIRDSEIIVDIVLSENFIELEEEKELKIIQGAGYQSETITFKGNSEVGDIFFLEPQVYSKIIDLKSETKHPVMVNSENRFEMKVKVSSHNEKYVCITNKDGKKLSIIRIY